MESLAALDLYLSACNRKRLSAISVNTYRVLLKNFLTDVPPDLDNITLEHIETWLDTLHLATSSLRNYLTNLIMFFRWTVRRGYLAASPFPDHYPLPKAKRSMRSSLSLEELTTLLSYVRNDTYLARRCHCMWNLIALTGLRISECASIRVGDITENGLIVRHGKGDKQRMVPLPPRVRTIVTAYMPFLRWAYMRTPMPDDWLFPGLWDKRPCNRTGLAIHFKRDLLTVGIRSHYTIHSLRHTYATLLVRAGVGVPVLQELLGHTNIATTMIYLHISAVDTTAAALKHPLATYG